jgi:hypothetical protein
MSNEKLKQELLQEVRRYVKEDEIPFIPFQGYEDYLSTGERVSFETYYFQRRRQLVVLGLGYYLENKKSTKKLLEQLLWEICNEYTWCLPAHLPIEKGQYAQNVELTIDLFAAETGQALSELVELIGDDLSHFLKERINKEIDRRIFRPFEEKSWEWEEKENNWSAVIGGCIGMTALSVIKNPVRQKQIINRLDKSMESYLASYGDDGACVEGVGYWNYGFGYFIYYAKKLADVLGDNRYLQLPKVSSIAKFPYYSMINPEKFLPFSDYSQSSLASGLVNFCAEVLHVPVPQMPTSVSSLDFDHCYRFAHIYRNLIWHNDEIVQPNFVPIHHYFEQAQWYIVKKPQEFFFAARAGHNQESHNHIDVGHFVVGTTENLFLTDIGAGEYTKDYFDDGKRYQYFPPSSNSHSIPVINQEKQQTIGTNAQVIEVTESSFGLELANFYPKAFITSFFRHFSLDQNQLLIEDRFAFQKDENQVQEKFITCIEPIISGFNVMLNSKSSNCRMTFSTDKIASEKVSYYNHFGEIANAYVITADYIFSESGDAKVQIEIINK